MAKLLLVSHTPSPNTRALCESAEAGVAQIQEIEFRSLTCQKASEEDVRWCDGIIIGTTENFGAMAGLTKDFFERIYYPCLEHTVALPAALYIRAGEDGSGTQAGIERIMSGLRWRLVQPPLILRGEYLPDFNEKVMQLGATLAAGLDAGIF